MPFKKGMIPWNKGINPWENKIHPRGMLGKTAWNKGLHIKFNNALEEYREKHGCTKKYKSKEKAKIETRLKRQTWVEKNRERINEHRREYRHRLGISKKYTSELGISYTKEYKTLHNQRYKALKKAGGDLPIARIQLVYEDNIKKYGTLTCYLCYCPIKFGKDELEHKIPLSRGGTNEYNNLAIAHKSCNCKKHDKTEKEYRKEIYNYGRKQ